MKLQVYLTDNCNLKCDYCFIDKHMKSLKFDLFKEAYNKLNIYDEDLQVLFCGGEPFLEISIIKLIINYLKKRHKQITFFITTNGTILNESLVELIIKENINISISFDGPPMIHNAHRRFKDNSETHSQVTEFINTLNKNNITYLIKTSINNYKLLYEVYNYMTNKMGVERLFISEVIDNEDFFKNTNEKYEYLKLWTKIIDEEYNRFINTGIWRLNNIVVLLGRVLKREKCSYFCGAGIDTICISNEGKIYPCYRAVQFPELEMNNQKDNEIYKELLNVNNKKSCKNCHRKYFCGGGCFINAYKYKENMNETYKSTCEINEVYSNIIIHLLEMVNGLSSFQLNSLLKQL